MAVALPGYTGAPAGVVDSPRFQMSFLSKDDYARFVQQEMAAGRVMKTRFARMRETTESLRQGESRAFAQTAAAFQAAGSGLREGASRFKQSADAFWTYLKQAANWMYTAKVTELSVPALDAKLQAATEVFGWTSVATVVTVGMELLTLFVPLFLDNRKMEMGIAMVGANGLAMAWTPTFRGLVAHIGRQLMAGNLPSALTHTLNTWRHMPNAMWKQLMWRAVRAGFRLARSASSGALQRAYQINKRAFRGYQGSTFHVVDGTSYSNYMGYSGGSGSGGGRRLIGPPPRGRRFYGGSQYGGGGGGSGGGRRFYGGYYKYLTRKKKRGKKRYRMTAY